MATNVWLGTAASQPEVRPFTAGGTVAVGSTFTLTAANGKAVTFTATTTSATDAATGLALAWAASQEPELREVTAASSGAVVTLTGPPDGATFVATPAAGGSGSPTLTAGTVTNGSGPNYWSAPRNWSLAAVPVAADDVNLDGSALVPIRYGLDQHTVTLGSLTAAGQFAVDVGLPDRNPAGYAEFREKRLRVGVTNPVNVGEGGGPGPSLFRWDAGAVQATLNCFAGNVEFVGTHASNVINRMGGTLKVATAPGSVATVLTHRCEDAGGGGFQGVGANTADVVFGPGVTLGTLIQAGGTVQTAATITTATTVEGGTLILIDAAGCSTAGPVVQEGGTVVWNSTGTLAAAVVYAGGKLDVSGDLRPKTVTNLTLYFGASFQNPNKVVIYTNPFAVLGCKLKDIDLDIGSNFNLNPT